MSASQYEQYVGNYRLLTNIWTGHGCQVWEVMHKSSHEKFAMKVQSAKHHGDKEQVGYLRNEFNVASSLKHPHIIKVKEFGMDDGAAFMVMDYFAAPNMKHWIRQGPEVALPLAAKAMEPALAALSYFHEQGWVHRDIKPDNFLIDSHGEIRLIDFALAQKPQGFLARLLGGKQKKIQGTPSYISPEAIRRQTLDQRADIYSLGCVLFEWLAGKLPYTGSSTNELLGKHLRNAPPSIKAANNNVTDGFGELLRRMMAKEPKDRPASIKEVLETARRVGIFRVAPKLSTPS